MTLDSLPDPDPGTSNRPANGELDSSAQRRRDGWLAALLAGATLVFGIAVWALEVYPDPFPYLFLTPAACSAPIAAVAVWCGVMAGASVAFGLSYLLPASRLARTWKSTIEAVPLVPILLLAAAAIQILRLQGVVQDCVSLRYGFLSLGALILAGLYFGRAATDLRPVLAVAFWAVLLLLAASTLQRLGTLIAFERASWLSRGAIVAYSLLFYALAAAPLVAVAPTGRRALERALQRLGRMPLVGHALVLGVALVTYAASRTEAVVDVRFEILLRSLAFLALLSLGSLLSLSGQPSTLARQDSHTRLFNAVSILLGVVFLGLLFRLAQAQLYDLDPDSYSYLSIARHYAQGDPVVRGYWSPLLPWLSAVPIAGGLDPIIAGRWIQGLAALAWVILSLRLGAAWGLSSGSRLALALALAGIVSLHAFRHFVPDLLGAAVLLPFFGLLFTPALLERPTLHGIALGVLAALAYYAKYYNLIFAAGLLGLSMAMRWLASGGGRRLARLLAAALATLAALVIPWVIAISARYGYLTISTSGEIGRTVAGPHVPTKHPCIFVQLCRTPADVLFPWEDPRPQDYAAYLWSPLDSLTHFRHQLVLPIWALDRLTSQVVDLYGPLPLLALAAQAAAMVLLPVGHGPAQPRGWAVGAVSLFCAGYLFLGNHVIRYFLPILPLALIFLFGWIEKLSQTIAPRGDTAPSLWATSLRTMIPLACLVSLVQPRRIAELATPGPAEDCLAKSASIVAPFAAAPMAGVGHATYFISYYAQVQTFGSLSLETPPSEVGLRLEELDIETVLV
ncbi:MAG: hypothetical protein ACRDHY_07485, partial [Anaerolineales bacterium]